MGTIWVKEFKGGLDARRLPATAPSSALLRAVNGHINSGGEFEKRAAFVPVYELPEGTKGLAAGATGVTVFGHVEDPGMPSGVTYQRLQHPDTLTALDTILSHDLYASKLYVATEFEDGSRHHYYDGAEIDDWFDGRARASFEIIAGGITPAVAATGSFEVSAGTANVANQVTVITIDGVDVLGAAVTHTGNNATTAAAVAAQITSYASSPNYTATSDGQTVTITAVTGGDTPNGKAIVPTVTGNFATSNVGNMGGGVDQLTSELTNLMVDGVAIISAPVLWTTSNEDTATAIAAAINSYTSTPDYTATAAGDRVNVIAAIAGAASNGLTVGLVLANGMEASPDTGIVLADGGDGTGYQPGSFVKTAGRRVYSTSGSVLHVSGTDAPTGWTTDNIGAAAFDMSRQAAGLEELHAVATYGNTLAVFADNTTIIWFIDADPALNRLVQVLNNTGTSCPRAVVPFGDDDLFYVHDSGIRSLRARDSSNAATTSDVGSLIDPLVKAILPGLTDEQRRNVFGAIEPRENRLWISFQGVIFVFSFYGAAQISAWTTYAPEYEDDEGEMIPFDIEGLCIFDRTLYVRSGDTIYAYGGLGSELSYDAAEAELWTAYFDANDPTRAKKFEAIDAAVEGTWQISAAMNPNDLDAADLVSTETRVSYNEGRHPAIGESTHVSVRLKTTGRTAARASAIVVHYEGDEDED